MPLTGITRLKIGLGRHLYQSSSLCSCLHQLSNGKQFPTSCYRVLHQCHTSHETCNKQTNQQGSYWTNLMQNFAGSSQLSTQDESSWHALNQSLQKSLHTQVHTLCHSLQQLWNVSVSVYTCRNTLDSAVIIYNRDKVKLNHGWDYLNNNNAIKEFIEGRKGPRQTYLLDTCI